MRILRDDRCNLFRFERARRFVVQHTVVGINLPLWRDRRRRDRGGLVGQQARVRDPAGMHDLAKHTPARALHRIGDFAPGGGLFLGVYPGGTHIAFTHRAREGTLADDQPGAGALPIVLGHQLVRDTVRAGAAAGHRCHDHPVGHFDRADLNRLQ